MFSSKCFVVLALVFKSIIYFIFPFFIRVIYNVVPISAVLDQWFELILVYGVK